MFDNTNNEVLETEDQKAAFQRYIRGGGGFVGIHSATGTMLQWPWFWAMLGGKFSRHAKMQTFTVKVLTEGLREQLKSEVADLKNTGERWGGAISAALFLREFVGDAAWAHLDIAGPSVSAKERGYLPKGGTGSAVRTLVEFVRAWDRRPPGPGRSASAK